MLGRKEGVMNSNARVLRFPEPKPRNTKRRHKESRVVADVRAALDNGNRLPALLGALLGGGMPVASYQTAHHDAAGNPWLWSVVAGCLLFSSLTVYAWGRAAFGSPAKALGYVLCLEVVMTFSPTEWLAVLALLFLVGINAVATGATLALGERRS